MSPNQCCNVLEGFIIIIIIIIIFYLPGDRLQQGEDLAAAVNAAASEQNYEAE